MPIKVICQQCGKEFAVTFASQAKSRKYCSRECSSIALGMARRTREKRVCGTCKKVFYAAPSIVGKGEGLYCSRSCASTAQRVRVKRVCEWCDRTFETLVSNVARGRAKFCSSACAYTARTGRSNPRWNRISCTCEVCGARYWVKASVRRAGGGRFCSRKCYGQWQSLDQTLDNNPNWHDGKSSRPYSTSFNESFKTQVRQRDNYTCALCQDHGNEIHHIDYDKEHTSFANCVTLCNVCHGKTNGNRATWHTILSDKVADKPLNGFKEI